MTFRSSLTVVLIAFSAPSSAATHTIVVEGMKFVPATLEVKSGDTIVWVNKDLFPHTATSDDKKTFDSGVIEAGASWKKVVKEKGTFSYFCTLHPPMKASITVK